MEILSALGVVFAMIAGLFLPRLIGTILLGVIVGGGGWWFLFAPLAVLALIVDLFTLWYVFVFKDPRNSGGFNLKNGVMKPLDKSGLGVELV